MRYESLELLAPVARSAFADLARLLAHDTPFRAFETYRGPSEQEGAFENGRSKAHAFESPHQFGLAVDFVPRINGNWTWNVPHELWDVLASKAAECGLLVPIAWDRAHVEHPAFKRVRIATRG
jgi:peptidoglycan L-alanyl-D-glutamate endopeptidase CwlK